MNSLRKTIALAQTCSRSVSQSAVRASGSSRLESLKRVQKSLTLEDGVPIYVKAGLKDKMLYNATLALATLGLSMVVHTLYSVSFPKKD